MSDALFPDSPPADPQAVRRKERIAALIGQVAAQHGVRLSPDDPLLAVVTINDSLLQEWTELLDDRHSQQVRDFADLMTEARDFFKRETASLATAVLQTNLENILKEVAHRSKEAALSEEKLRHEMALHAQTLRTDFERFGFVQRKGRKFLIALFVLTLLNLFSSFVFLTT